MPCGQLSHVLAIAHEARRHGHGPGPVAGRNSLAPACGNEHKEYLASEGVISTDFYPMGVQGRFEDAGAGKTCPTLTSRWT